MQCNLISLTQMILLTWNKQDVFNIHPVAMSTIHKKYDTSQNSVKDINLIWVDLIDNFTFSKASVVRTAQLCSFDRLKSYRQAK